MTKKHRVIDGRLIEKRPIPINSGQLILLLLLLFASSIGRARSLDVSTLTEKMKLAPHTAMFHDTSGFLALRDRLQKIPNFTNLTDRNGNLGFRKAMYGSSFNSTVSQITITITLDTDLPTIDEGGFYTPISDGSYTT